MIQFQIYAGLHTASGDCSPTTINRNRDTLRRLADDQLPGYTWQDVTGRWDRKNESSVILTVIGSAADAEAVRMVAGRLKELAEQESVMITTTELGVSFV